MNSKLNFYSGATEVLTTDGFKKINQLDGSENLLVLNSDNDIKVAKDFVVEKEKQYLSNISYNRRSVQATKKTIDNIFYSVDYRYSESLDDPMVININDRDYNVTLYQYILVGYALFNLFMYDTTRSEFIFKPPIRKKDKVLIDIDKAFDGIEIDMSDDIVNYIDRGVAFTLRSNSFPDGVRSYIRVILENLIKHKKVLEPFIDNKFIYEYADTNTGESVKYLNIKNKELEKIFCLLCNMYYGAGVVKKKPIGWSVVFINNITCYKDDVKDITPLLTDSGIRECYSIRLNTENSYHLISVVANSYVVNFNFIPAYKKSE